MIVHAPREEEGSLARLRVAAQEFWTAWQAPHHPMARTANARHAAAGLALALCVAVGVMGWWLDGDVALRMRALPIPVVLFFEKVTHLGQSGYIFFLSALAVIFGVLARNRGLGARVDAGLTHFAARAAFLFVLMAASGIAAQVLKHLFGRARPRLMDVAGPFHFDIFSVYATYASFPSGHSVTAFAAAAALSWFMPRLRWPLFALACLIAMSRIAIDAHYVSDVLTGAALGVGSAIWLRRAFAARRIAFQNTPDGPRVRAFGAVGLAMSAVFSFKNARKPA